MYLLPPIAAHPGVCLKNVCQGPSLPPPEFLLHRLPLLPLPNGGKLQSTPELRDRITSGLNLKTFATAATIHTSTILISRRRRSWASKKQLSKQPASRYSQIPPRA